LWGRRCRRSYSLLLVFVITRRGCGCGWGRKIGFRIQEATSLLGVIIQEVLAQALTIMERVWLVLRFELFPYFSLSCRLALAQMIVRNLPIKDLVEDRLNRGGSTNITLRFKVPKPYDPKCCSIKASKRALSSW